VAELLAITRGDRQFTMKRKVPIINPHTPESIPYIIQNLKAVYGVPKPERGLDPLDVLIETILSQIDHQREQRSRVCRERSVADATGCPVEPHVSRNRMRNIVITYRTRATPSIPPSFAQQRGYLDRELFG
jgi:hypothetical protein